MTTTGLFSYNPATSNLVLQAYARIGIRRAEIVTQHLEDAYNEANLVQVEMGNRLPNLFLDELYTQTLTEGTATYTLPSRFLAIQAPYLSITPSGAGTPQDILIYGYSVYEYSAIPDKTSQGQPTVYWLNLLATPEISFWPVPDGNSTYVFKARIQRQVQDASLASGATTDVTWQWLDVYVAKLAHRLARIYARELEAQRRLDAEEAWTYAASTGKEQVPQFLQVQTYGYYR